MSDAPIQRVTYADLLKDSARFNGLRIQAEGPWWSGFESSSFAGAWLEGGTRGLPQMRFVRVTGTWRHGHFGHMGMSDATVEIESLETITPTPIRVPPTVLREPERWYGKALEMKGTLSRALNIFNFEGHQLMNDARFQAVLPAEPDEARAREVCLTAVLTPEMLYPLALETRWGRSPYTVSPPMVTPAALRSDPKRYGGHVIAITGLLSNGAYWPTLEGFDVVPPAVARTPSRYTSSSSPPHPEVAKWKTFLTARGAPAKVQVQAYVHVDGRRVSLFALSVSVEGGGPDE